MTAKCLYCATNTPYFIITSLGIFCDAWCRDCYIELEYEQLVKEFELKCRKNS